jgi:hypothetical protein
VFLGKKAIVLTRTSLTGWHDRRGEASHEHDWAMAGCSASLNIWDKPIIFYCGRGDPAGKRAGWLGKVLTRLEVLDADRAFHRHLTTGAWDRREAAADAADSFNEAWTDEEIGAWWEKTQRFLRLPEQGRGSFAAYDPPPLPPDFPR